MSIIMIIIISIILIIGFYKLSLMFFVLSGAVRLPEKKNTIDSLLEINFSKSEMLYVQLEKLLNSNIEKIKEVDSKIKILEKQKVKSKKVKKEIEKAIKKVKKEKFKIKDNLRNIEIYLIKSMSTNKSIEDKYKYVYKQLKKGI